MLNSSVPKNIEISQTTIAEIISFFLLKQPLNPCMRQARTNQTPSETAVAPDTT